MSKNYFQEIALKELALASQGDVELGPNEIASLKEPFDQALEGLGVKYEMQQVQCAQDLMTELLGLMHAQVIYYQNSDDKKEYIQFDDGCWVQFNDVNWIQVDEEGGIRWTIETEDLNLTCRLMVEERLKSELCDLHIRKNDLRDLMGVLCKQCNIKYNGKETLAGPENKDDDGVDIKDDGVNIKLEVYFNEGKDDESFVTTIYNTNTEEVTANIRTKMNSMGEDSLFNTNTEEVTANIRTKMNSMGEDSLFKFCGKREYGATKISLIETLKNKKTWDIQGKEWGDMRHYEKEQEKDEVERKKNNEYGTQDDSAESWSNDADLGSPKNVSKKDNLKNDEPTNKINEINADDHKQPEIAASQHDYDLKNNQHGMDTGVILKDNILKDNEEHQKVPKNTMYRKGKVTTILEKPKTHEK